MSSSSTSSTTTEQAAAAAGTVHDDSSSSSSSNIPQPQRCIYNDADLRKFLDSPAKHELLKLITAMGKSCAAPNLQAFDPTQPLRHLSPSMACLHGALTEMHDVWLTELPPHDAAAARFGNPVFQQWHSRLKARSPRIIHAMIVQHQQARAKGASLSSYNNDDNNNNNDSLQAAAQAGKAAASNETPFDWTIVAERDDRIVIQELCAYLHDAFGHPIRLDYGTGHESSFQVFLFALCKLGFFGSSSSSSTTTTTTTAAAVAAEPPSPARLKAITLSMYTAYLQVCRQVQTDYMLEPAGSHGVWGLDDYHCLPFYFGACQMQSQADNADAATPAVIQDSNRLAADGDQLLYLGCIRYIQKLKRGVPFFECSPMLHDISHLASWTKVAAGLLRLYEGEVLQKRPVVQHFLFGKLFAANWKPSTHAAPAPPPEQSFRTALPAVRAPWANTTTTTTPPMASLPATRAPWAKKPNE